jgi:uncharacterized protein involved in propanediol utilization
MAILMTARDAREVPFCSTGTAPATFGELIQGRESSSGDDFLVTLPITLNSVVKFYGFIASPAIYVFPRRKTKSLKAAQLFFERSQIRTGGIIRFCSDVAEGKGLSSSSADMVATLRAIAGLFSLDITADDMLAIMREVEPTDGVMFDDAVYFLHRKVELRSVLGRLPKMCILAIDEGGTIDTVSYNQKHFDFSDAERSQYDGLLLDITKAIRNNDVKGIGASATESSRLHQKRNYKHALDALESLQHQLGAEGIVTCHSGTFIGMCFDAGAPESLAKILKAEQTLGDRLGTSVVKFFSR